MLIIETLGMLFTLFSLVPRIIFLERYLRVLSKHWNDFKFFFFKMFRLVQKVNTSKSRTLGRKTFGKKTSDKKLSDTFFGNFGQENFRTNTTSKKSLCNLETSRQTLEHSKSDSFKKPTILAKFL